MNKFTESTTCGEHSRTNLPPLRSKQHCVLMPKDPHGLHAYWHINPAHALQESSFILRVHEISSGRGTGQKTWDIDVDLSQKSCYIQVPSDNADYCVELGLRDTQEGFLVLERSNRAHTPLAGPSERKDLIWQDIKDDEASAPYIEADPAGLLPVDAATGSPHEALRLSPSRGLRQRLQEEIKDALSTARSKTQKTKSRPITSIRKKRIYYLTPQDIYDYYMNLFASVSRRGRRKTAKKVFSMEDILKGRLKKLPWAKVQSLWPDLGGPMRGASLMRQPIGASESLSSFQMSAQNPGPKKFFFDIWAELIVHGRTESGAKVLLNQKEVTLNPDGSFSLYYSLPDGPIPFEFVAQSSDRKQQRHISTRVERERTRAA